MPKRKDLPWRLDIWVDRTNNHMMADCVFMFRNKGQEDLYWKWMDMDTVTIYDDEYQMVSTTSHSNRAEVTYKSVEPI